VVSGEKAVPCLGRKGRENNLPAVIRENGFFSSFIKDLGWLTVPRTSKLLACLLIRIFLDVSSFVVYLASLGVSCCICGLLC